MYSMFPTYVSTLYKLICCILELLNFAGLLSENYCVVNVWHSIAHLEYLTMFEVTEGIMPEMTSLGLSTLERVRFPI